jgi:hypothetical protein
VIDIETVQSTQAGTRFHQAIAVLLGIIAVLAAALGAVQLDRSQDEARATTLAARLTADLAALVPLYGIGFEMTFGGVQVALAREAEGTTRQFLAIGVDEAAVAEGKAEEAAGARLRAIAFAMGATPDSTSGLPAYELRLLTTDEAALNAEVTEQNRLVDADASLAGAESSAAIAGLSVLALAGVLVGLASVVGASRAGRVTLVMAGLATATAAALLVTILW